MKYSRFLCIVLCLILLVSISPIQAHAAATGIVIGGMTVTELILNGALGVTAILGALGLAKDINDQTGAWDNLVASATGFLTDAGIIKDDNMTIQQTENGQLFVGSDVIQSVKDWLFSSSTISSSSFGNGNLMPLVLNSGYVPMYYDSYRTLNLLDNSSSVYYWRYLFESSGYLYCNFYFVSDSNFSISRTISGGSDVLSHSSYSSSLGCYVLVLEECINTKYSYDSNSVDISPFSSLSDFVKNQIGIDCILFPEGVSISSCPPSVNTDIAVNYIDWYKLALQANGYDPNNPPADKLPYWPLSFSKDQNEIDTLSQEELWSGLNSSLADIESGIGEGNVTLGDIKLLIKDFFTKFPQFLEQLWEDIRNLPQTLTEYVVEPIVQALKELFVPDVADITAAIDVMKLKFPFFDSIIGTWKSFQLRLSGSPPVIYAHLQNAEGNYSWGGTVAVLDMSFYERYKSLGDAVLSAALWCFFGWRMFVKLPGIISGVPGDVQTSSYVDDIERGSRKK